MDSTSAAPLSDAKVFKEQPSKHSALPQRNIFNVDIVDSQSGALQVLDSLQRSGPLHFKGWVPIEETKHANAKDSGKFIYIFGEIIEWTHQFDPARPKRPIFWLKSYGSVTTVYEPYFTPLVKVCSYLDVLVQLVVEMRIKDDLKVLIPQVAVLLAEPESMVSRMLQRHRKQLLALGASDSIIRGSNFYKSWAAHPAGSSGKSKLSHSPGVFGHVEYDTFTDDIGKISDSEIDAQSPHSNHYQYHCHVGDTDNSDVNANSPPLVASKPLLPIVSYDMADREVIPELETKVETYEELPAPCADDFCFLHPVFNDITCNAISTDMRLLSSKRVLRTYLAKPWKRPVRPKAWDVSAKQLNMVRQMRGASMSSVTQFLEPLEAIPSTTPFHHLAIETTAENTRTSLVQETIATSTSFVRKSPSPERYQRYERDSSGSPVHRIRLKRRVPSNDSNHSGNEDVGPGRKRQDVGHPLRTDVSEDNDGAGTEMRTGSAHGSMRRSLSRGRATMRRNEMQPTRRNSRSRSKARPDMNATGTALRRSARSRSKPRPFGSSSVNENQSSGRAQGRSKSSGRFDNFDDSYADGQSGLGSEKGVDSSGYGPEPVYEEVTIHERGRSRTPKRIERAVIGSNVKSGLISRFWNVYRAPSMLLATTTVPKFMRCYKCQALIRSSDDHRSCMELGSEEFPVVLTADDC
ncbi:hypothetical protein KI688_008193 [Linnemannia hyalina]|uniref:Uncharacterized protein n=1 Tax=Linnemannia hyalina TaxID=64524 RepID=A0A9P7Y0F4_9FUNG|nr:hypothetical protein KI688_008193 [Linnemannia hyalina]